jgi:hypothetical protein
MLPDSTFSATAASSSFINEVRTDAFIDFELGGIAIGDASQGLLVKKWECAYEDEQIKIGYENHFETVLTVEKVTYLSFAFDINMRPIIAYVADGNCHLWWYDSQQSEQVNTNLGACIFPQLSLDEKRSALSANADVIFAYIRNSKLYMRIQRERFQIEHEITQAKRLIQIGMMTNYRFGFAYYNWD